MGEDEGGAGDVADFAGAGGDVLEGAPALAEQGEPAFAQAAQRALDGVAGAGIDVKFAAGGWLFDGDEDADSGAVVAGVGEGGQSGGGCLVESGQGVDTGGGDVVHRAGLGAGDPQGEPARGEDGLDVATVGVGLAGVPQVDDLAFHANGRLFAPVGRDDLAVQDHVREPLVFGSFQRLVQVRSLLCEDGDHLVHIPVGGGPGDAVVTGQRPGAGAVAEPPHTQHGLPKAGQRPAAARGAAAVTLGQQQFGGELHQFPGDVKRGTIGDHVEPSAEVDLVVRPSSTGAPRPCLGGPVPPRVCPDVPVWAG
jgi:hypothetical protein